MAGASERAACLPDARALCCPESARFSKKRKCILNVLNTMKIKRKLGEVINLFFNLILATFSQTIHIPKNILYSSRKLNVFNCISIKLGSKKKEKQFQWLCYKQQWKVPWQNIPWCFNYNNQLLYYPSRKIYFPSFSFCNLFKCSFFFFFGNF